MNQTNKHATVRTRIDRNGRLRTETARRDNGFDVAITTDIRTNSTRLFIDEHGRPSEFCHGTGVVELNGREARTLYRALQRHFEAQDKHVG